MSKITVTFEVDDSNMALLMLACHDILTGVDFDESMAAYEKFELILEFFADRSQECLTFLRDAWEQEPGDLLSGLVELQNKRYSTTGECAQD